MPDSEKSTTSRITVSGHVKHAAPDHPVLTPIAERWSPYVFDERPVEREKLLTCLEAARWAESSYNEQPWIFFLSERTNPAEFERGLECLLEANQVWAKHAGVLILTAISRTFKKNGSPNRVAEHDLGIAAAHFALQAAALGLQAHQMAGVNLTKVKQTYNLPEGYDPMTAIALGYAGAPPGGADPQLAPRDATPRSRKALSEFVFAGDWGQPAAF
jgi:nitroreductase